MKLPQSVSTITKFIQWAEAAAYQCVISDLFEAAWFRGSNASKHKLIPSLYRSQEGLSNLSDFILRGEFKRRALPLVAERPPRDDWEWYFLMQHFGAPTRLLDWTDSALVALYFAINSAHRSDEELARMKPTIWALNPWQLNRRLDEWAGPINPASTSKEDLMFKYLEKPYDKSEDGSMDEQLRYPIAIDPNFIAQRMLVQHSHFTLHGHDQRGLDELIDVAELNLGNGLHKVTVSTDSNGIKKLRWDLAILGITETTIYPDLTGLSRELNLEYGIVS